MADNITVDTITGNPKVATDDDGTAHHQYVKLEFGADNTQTKVTSSVGLPTNPLNDPTRDLGKVDVANLDQYTPNAGRLPVLADINAAQTLATVTTVGTVNTVSAVTAITNALPAGTNAIGKLSANSGVDIGDVDVATLAQYTPVTRNGANALPVSLEGQVGTYTDTTWSNATALNTRVVLSADLQGACVMSIATQVTAGSPATGMFSVNVSNDGSIWHEALRMWPTTQATAVATDDDLISDLAFVYNLAGWKRVSIELTQVIDAGTVHLYSYITQGQAPFTVVLPGGGSYVVTNSVLTAWNESSRAKVNPIVGQAGVAAGAGAVGATVQRTTLASDDPAVTALQIMDDWDESDRAKVNLIVGQAGVAAGAGAVGATVPRVTLASDDPAVASLGVMDDWDNAASDGASVSGDVAHDSVDAGEPVKIGGKATATLSGGTNVAAADRANWAMAIDGAGLVRDVCLEDVVNGNASNTDGSSTQCIAAQAANVKTYLTDIILTNTSATMTYVEIKDGSTAKLTIPVPATGGAVLNLKTPIPGTAATAWNFDPGAATTTIYCSMSGFKSKI